MVRTGIFNPPRQFIARQDRTGGVIGKTEVDDIGFLLRQIGIEMILLTTRQPDDRSSRHAVRIHIGGIRGF